MVIAGMLPLHLKLTGRGVEQWQREWEASPNAAWTRRLIPQLELWLARRHGEVGFALAQVLSGHGNFGAYLYRFKIRPTGVCPDCPGEAQTAEHALFECRRWEAERRRWSDSMGGGLTPDTLVAHMIESPQKWAATEVMAKTVTDGD